MNERIATDSEPDACNAKRGGRQRDQEGHAAVPAEVLDGSALFIAICDASSFARSCRRQLCQWKRAG